LVTRTEAKTKSRFYFRSELQFLRVVTISNPVNID
jgi:hypothetical protein